MKRFKVTDPLGRDLTVVQYQVNTTDVFQVAGKDLAPVIIVKAEAQNGDTFWATLPEDPSRYRDAQLSGAAISAHLKQQDVLL